MRKDRFSTIFILQVVFAFAVSFGWSLIYFYFLKSGFSSMHVLLYFTLIYVSSSATILLVTRVHSKQSIITGLLLRIVTFVLVYRFVHVIQLFLVAIVFGVAISLFWIPVNIAYFATSSHDTKAFHSSIAIALWPFVGAICPFLSGVVANFYGFQAVFLISIAILLIDVFITMNLSSNSLLQFDLKRTIQRIKGLKTLLLLQGFWQGVNWIAVPVISFFFITKELEYGSFLAYLSVVGAVASLLLGKLSDKTENRLTFIIPSIIFTGIFTLLSGLGTTFVEWALFRGVVSFFGTIAASFSLTVVVDRTDHLEAGMIGRELFINGGRVIGGLIVLLFAQLGRIQLSLVVSGIAFFVYPFVLLKHEIYSPPQYFPFVKYKKS
ncbi:MAG: MFS transporter [Candidatus Korarchaeota archaeon]|nr:MFS transporter [Candidatus Korarchaeota archaeon]NIU82257.1 hypothetical protein [Candidatus Thorarchaeota archaeon]NIW12708.1 hypothetical protein [Candidatus Thorarchaeota archaeon]NIW50921.1 hypothetical protein [Candidatus Korarchaeota archaeon]